MFFGCLENAVSILAIDRQLWLLPSRSGSFKMLLCEGHVLMIYYVDQTLTYALT